MRDDSANTLDALTQEEHRPPKVVKSSLKGSRSQLSLEEVALAARRNAARRHTRNKADGILRSLLHCAEKARKGRSRRGSISSRKSLDIRSHLGAGAKQQQQHQPQAIVIACTDCDLPLPEAFGAAATDVVVLRSKGNFATPAVASDVARLIGESGIRLVIVLGHTHCSAIDVAVDRWLERKASAWPWMPRIPQPDLAVDRWLERKASARPQKQAQDTPKDPVHAFHLQHDLPAKVPKASIDPEKRPKKVADEPTRTDKFSMTGNMEGGSFWKSLSSCYCGADMAQDESHHSRSSPSQSSSPDVSQRSSGPRAMSSSAALNCSDRTVVLSLGNTLEAAVDEVALERLQAEEAERESLAADEPLPDPERVPIEAPRAPRRTGSDLSTRTSSMQAAHDKKEAAVIKRDDCTALEVTNANAKLAAEALLRGLSKRVDNSVMQELEVVAVSADVDTSKLSLLRKGWYQHATYFFE